MSDANGSMRSSSVVLVKEDRDNMCSNWMDAVVVSRDVRKNFRVYARKRMEWMEGSGNSSWRTLESQQTRAPAESLIKAVESMADFLQLEIDWADSVPALATLDWPMAAAIATQLEVDLPELPSFELLEQQHSRLKRASVTVEAEWGYDSHTLVIPLRHWIDVVNGIEYLGKSKFWYEGEKFSAKWSFNCQGPGTLEVCYGNDGAAGYEGSVLDLHISGVELCGLDIAKTIAEATHAT